MPFSCLFVHGRVQIGMLIQPIKDSERHLKLSSVYLPIFRKCQSNKHHRKRNERQKLIQIYIAARQRRQTWSFTYILAKLAASNRINCLLDAPKIPLAHSFATFFLTQPVLPRQMSQSGLLFYLDSVISAAAAEKLLKYSLDRRFLFWVNSELATKVYELPP